MADAAPSGARGPSSFVPHGVGDTPESGWDRVCEIFQRNERGESSQEAELIVKSALTGALIGLVYGGVPAARFSREQYIKHSQAEVFRHRIEAVRSVHNAALRGFLRYGFRWGWRVAAFVSIFNCVSTGLSAYRDKVVVSNFAAAGAVTGGLFRLNLGLRGLVGGSVIGALLGVPAGALISGLQSLAGEDLRQHKRQERRHLSERQLQEWTERVAYTDVIVQEIREAGEESSEQEVEKINELLQHTRTAAPEQ
ncbi:complex I assembly factor TIMMDC1, mitochondrial [Bufo bufo]|uniref:complex I assembly factor TIMMDC1, mitochondrial n=1 Tax=Bufo bufo TaxID=8384 RepID=UPI001ABDA05C|nr:complex I assembly factor TIMMDC1, mitochondrial [Bufo bufo]XP_040278694.1 complex I assembly factor TIMMDC1, mitochondrial [Bufo bufo]